MRKGANTATQFPATAASAGPDLSYAGDLMTRAQMATRIYSGAANMPSYVGNIAPNDLNPLLSFLESRRRKPAPQLRHAAD